MKLTSTILALAIAGALLASCDRPSDTQASRTMGQAATGGTTGEKHQDQRTTPKEQSAPMQKPSGK